MLMPGPPADAASAAPAPALGAHVLLVQTEGKGTSPAVSQPLTTQASGSSLLALVSSYASNPDGPTDSYANHWTPLGGSVVYRNYEGRFDARAYVALSVKGGPGHTISVVKPGRPAGEISVPFIEITGANQLQDVARNYPGLSLAERALNKFKRGWRKLTGVALGTSTVLTSGAVTTTGPATLVAVWWGDGRVLKMTATPGDGFKLIDSFLDLPPNSGVQCAVAVKQVAVAGTYKVSWSGTPAQGAILWLFAFQHQAR
ncbi:hypothetical protein B0E47_11645 [Rhodanobacter sp. B05]|jgi:hypothetical protein|nr:hypothetical protein B0E47_11645 [Rhodanobacter sp. B05]